MNGTVAPPSKSEIVVSTRDTGAPTSLLILRSASVTNMRVRHRLFHTSRLPTQLNPVLGPLTFDPFRKIFHHFRVAFFVFCEANVEPIRHFALTLSFIHELILDLSHLEKAAYRLIGA